MKNISYAFTIVLLSKKLNEGTPYTFMQNEEIKCGFISDTKSKHSQNNDLTTDQ